MIIKIELPKGIMKGSATPGKLSITLDKAQADYLMTHTDYVPACLSTVATTLSEFVETLVEQLRTNNKERIRETYACAMNRFLQFRGGHDIALDAIGSQEVEAFESHLKQAGLTLNTVSFYMRVLRAIYNKAVRQLSITDKRPFDRVFTGYPRTPKRAVDVETITLVAGYRTTNADEALARDLFLFSFYTRGMSFVDIANLRRCDIRNGHLIYKRSKTGQELQVAWRPEMQTIVDRHPSLDGDHLLGVLNNDAILKLRRQYQQQQSKVNYHLKRLSMHLGLSKPLTMYVARHSWATIARGMDIPVSVISDSLGHHSEKTTQIYLKSIDADVIDRANEKLIAAVENNG